MYIIVSYILIYGLGSRLANTYHEMYVIKGLICDKKGYVNFWGKAPHFPKKLLNVPLKQFFTVFSENIAFFFKFFE